MRAIIVLPLFLSIFLSVEAQSIPPSKSDGFVYGNLEYFNPNKILIEAFFDPLCPYSRDAWPHLKKALQFYGSKLSLVVHPFPLPYHDNAYIASRAIHIVNGLNSSAVFTLWESFFKHQEKFSNTETLKFSKIQIADHLINFVSASARVRTSDIKSGLSNTDTDHKTRVSFKYSTSRGVFGTPTLFVNGFSLPHAPQDFNEWKNIIDPLLN